MENLYVGIEIGGTKLQIVAGNAARIHERVRLSVDKSLGAEGIRHQLAMALQELLTRVQASAIGLGFGGPVDWKSGTIALSHQIGGWSQFDIKSWLHSLTGLPVFVDNDANVAALGEAIYGAGMGLNPVFYVTLGSGVGGGLIADKQIYHGAVPGEAEIGHIRLDRDGNTVESRCSGWAVDAKIQQLIKQSPESILSDLVQHTQAGQAKHLATALQKGDKLAMRILEETAQDLTFGLSHVVHLFHPEILILGGGLSLIGEPLQQAVAKALPSYIMNAFLPGPLIRLAQLQEDAVPIGALALAHQKFHTPDKHKLLH